MAQNNYPRSFLKRPQSFFNYVMKCRDNLKSCIWVIGNLRDLINRKGASYSLAAVADGGQRMGCVSTMSAPSDCWCGTL
jgi:hypothetical protein